MHLRLGAMHCMQWHPSEPESCLSLFSAETAAWRVASLFNELQEARAKLQAQAEVLRDGDPADPAAEGDEKRAAANVDAGKPAPAAAVGKARSTPLLLPPPPSF